VTTSPGRVVPPVLGGLHLQREWTVDATSWTLRNYPHGRRYTIFDGPANRLDALGPQSDGRAAALELRGFSSRGELRVVVDSTLPTSPSTERPPRHPEQAGLVHRAL